MSKTYTNVSTRTRNSIKQAFTCLLEKNDFLNISVTDILEESRISRTTFYSYYEDKYALARDIMADYMNATESFIDALSVRKPLELTKSISVLYGKRLIFHALEKLPDNEFNIKNEFYLLCKRKLNNRQSSYNNDTVIFISTLTYTFVSFVSESNYIKLDDDFSDNVISFFDRNLLKSLNLKK